MNVFYRCLRIMAVCSPAFAFAGSDVVVQVADEGLAPVLEARVDVGFFGPRTGMTPTFFVVSGVTDRTGRFVARRKSPLVASIQVSKTGFYESAIEYGGEASTFNLTLKRIGNPVPLFAKAVEFNQKIPIGGSISYDFEIGDWCPPYGKGVRSDIIFSRQGYYVDPYKPFDVTFTISFAEVADGIQEAAFDEASGSMLRLPREAPAEGYIPTIQRRIHRSEESGTVGGRRQSNRGHFIRVRSAREGERIVGNYVKIQGDFDLGAGGSLRFIYYFNPRRGERNLEWDTKKNLFKELRRDEFISEP